MRISCFLYFFLLASPVAAEAPLSAIDWLSIKKNDVESSLKSVEKESSDTNKDIQVSTLSSDKFQSIGLLPVYVTGIPTTIWRNSSFNDLTFSSATVTANGAIIYNSTTAGGSSTTDAVCVLAFGGDKTSTNGDFTIQFPTANASNAIIRIA